MAVAYNNTPSIDDDNLETFALLWLDAEVNSSEENRHAQRQLRSTINYLKTFEDANLCRQYIQFVSPYDRLVLIVSGRLGPEIVKAVTTELDDLISRIKFDQKNLVKIEDPIIINVFTVVDNIDQTTTGMNGHFVHSLLLIDVLLRMKPLETDKQELIALCKNEYQGNKTQLDIIHEFQGKYSLNSSLWWYTRESFLYKMLNKALRKQNIDILFHFWFFYT